jgi:exopolysaccharide biosynthesis protein
MKFNRELKTKTLAKLLVVLIILTTLSGCASVIVHPIEKIDFVIMSKGATYTAEKDGYFLSDYYFQNILKARVKK